MTDKYLWFLVPLTTSSVTDVRINCTAAYCLLLEQAMSSKRMQSLTASELNDLTLMYTFEPIILSGRDFTTAINSSVLKVLLNAAPDVEFGDTVHQQLSTILMADGSASAKADQEIVMKILCTQVMSQTMRRGLPAYCLNAVENVLLNGSENFELCANILTVVLQKFRQSVNPAVLDAVQQRFDTEPRFERICFLLTFAAICIQDIQQYLFQKFDLEFASARLLASYYSTPTLGLDEPLSQRTKNCLFEHLKRCFQQGAKMSMLNKKLFESCVRQRINVQSVLECLLLVCENGQILPRGIIDGIFGRDAEEPQVQGSLLRLASAIVQNNQPVPKGFTQVIVANVCSGEFPDLFRNPENCAKLSIVTKLMHNNFEVPEISDVTAKLCDGWRKESGGNHRQRLDILSALSGQVSSVSVARDLDPQKLKTVFVDAMSLENAQMIETALNGFIVLCHRSGAAEAALCDDSDFKLLMKLQQSAASSKTVKEAVSEFLASMHHVLPARVKASLNLAHLENKTNTEVIADLPMLCKLDDFEFFESQQCQVRLQKILEGDNDPQVLLATLGIIASYPRIHRLPEKTLEAVGFTQLSTTNAEVAGRCQMVIATGLEKGIQLSEKLKAYISSDQQHSIQNSQNETGSLDRVRQLCEQLTKEKTAEAVMNVQNQIRQFELGEIVLTRLWQSDVTQSPAFPEFLANNIPSAAILKALGANRQLRTKTIEIFCHEIRTRRETVADALLEALTTVLSMHDEAATTTPEEFIGVFLNSFADDAPSVTRIIRILQCLVALIKLAGSSKQLSVQPKVLQFLLLLLQHPLCFVRRQCVLALRTFDSVMPAGNPETITAITGLLAQRNIHFDPIAANAFQQIFPDNESAQQLKLDTKFNRDFAGFLLGLTGWDFDIIKPVRSDREKWRQLMLVSDFVLNFADSINSAVELHNYVKIIAQKFRGDEEREEFFDYLTVACLTSSALKLPETLSALKTLDMSELTDLLRMSSENFERQLAERVILKLLPEKVIFTKSPQVLSLLAQQLISTFGIDLATTICTACEQIEHMQEFTGFIDYFEGTTIKDWTGGKYRFGQQTFKAGRLHKVAAQLGTAFVMQGIPEKILHRQRMERVITELLKNGVQLRSLLQLVAVCTTASPALKSFEHAIGQAYQYRLTGASFTAFANAVSLAKSESEIVSTVNKFTRENVFDGKYGVKQAAQIVNEFRRDNTRVSYKWSCLRERFVKAGYEWEILQLQIFRIFNADFRSRVYKSDTLVNTWTDTDISQWALQAFARKNDYRPAEFVAEALAIARLAMEKFKNFVLTKVQILSCLVALDKLKKDTSKGQLQQVATGSGKSAIVAVLAAVKALEGHTVDIYTSSPVLAERDAQEWAPFYQMFGLTCGHNGDKGVYVAKKKPCYDQQIVYGECAQFQFDYLRDKYSGLGTLGGRKTDFAIVDEVDSALIDDSAKLARLSTTLPGMDTLHVLYCLIWDRLSHIQSHLFSIRERQFYLEGRITADESIGTFVYEFANPQDELLTIRDLIRFILEATNVDLETARIFAVDNLEEFVKNHMKTYINSVLESDKLDLQFPVHIKDFAQNQIPLWVDSALAAVKYQENVHYIVDEGQIKPVDYLTTGVVQSSTNWNNGLHQFLQLKHSLKVNSETVTTNFLSNYSMFNKYGTNIIGFTGTLGSSYEREIMYNIYHVKLLVLPETYFKRYIQFPDVCVETEEQWLKEILITAMAETSKKRGVLVICETIKTAHLIASVFSGYKVKVKLYTKNQEGQEKHIERLHPGDVVVATNLAGRGTDLKTTEIEEYGGLHVCLTFLPCSQRTEEQAFGRTSRQGNKGTGQLIIIGDPRSDYKHQRDLEEKRTLEDFRDRELAHIQMKGELFENFCEYYNMVRHELQIQCIFLKNISDQIKDTAQLCFGVGSRSSPSLIETVTLLSVEEQWAKFLMLVDREKLNSEQARAKFHTFKTTLEKVGNNQELIKASHNAFYFVQLGNFHYLNEKYADATEYHKIAVQMDPLCSVGAKMGLAAASLKQRKSSNYKSEAIEEFNGVLSLLYKEMSTINMMQALSQRQLPPGSDSDTPLFQQLIQKANLLGYFINIIQANIDATERSLRKVNLEYEAKSNRYMMRLSNDLLLKESQERHLDDKIKSFEKFSLTFHDQTVYSDCGDNDQAVQTLPGTDISQLMRSLPGTASSLLKGSLTETTASLLKGSLPGTAASQLKRSLKVSLHCESADISSLLDDSKLDLFKKVPEVSVGVLKMHRDFEKEGKLPFRFNKIEKVCVTSFDIEFSGASETLAAVAENLITNSTAFQHGNIIVAWADPENDHLLISKILPSGMSERDKLDIIKQRNGNWAVVQVTGLAREAEVHGAIEALGKEYHHAAAQLNIDLTLRGLKEKTDQQESEPFKEVLKAAWNKEIANYKTNLILSEMSTDNAKDVIKALRKHNIKFTMRLYNLNWDDANTVLKRAEITQEAISQTKVQELPDMFTQTHVPLQEIRELSARGIVLLVSFNEKQFIPWISLCSICALASVQALAGGVLIVTGFGASVGMALVTEAMSDLTTIHRMCSSRHFSWSDYATQKAVSLLISATTLGLNSLRNSCKGAKFLVTGTAASALEAAAAETAIIQTTAPT
ncbi:uncharacterized protein LOC129600024 [Paramacrobiotus metropolitanus]|uniref:uncharacterized protein LOC129600024 n=1 Tax=Paramacrobiotus metropolitanus TaxID=2943436 RepID=UPI002445A90E|nr:uncharacterized protein LOC129600024 [Paramacrobiotus metropolitanus]